MAQPVFISYARETSREHARALHEALGGQTAFLDTEAIPLGDRFQEAVVDALFDAQVVVIFAEPTYFTRWYCLLEFRIARTPFLRTLDRPGASVTEKENALRGLVVARPAGAVDPMLERFPLLVQGRNWPDVGDINRIAEFVLAELATNPRPLRERYASVADADAARAFLLNEAVHLPPPRKIGNIPYVPVTGLPHSIHSEFVGRADDLWRIHDLLWTERGNPATAAGLTGAIEATGGFGKTRLALEYLYRFGPRYFKGGLFWIDAERDPELQLYDVLLALNPSAAPIEIIRQAAGGVAGTVARSIRAQPDDSLTPLFIIDNVPEPEKDHLPKPLSTWCPVLGEVPVLTTSRTHVALGPGGVVPLPIETLAPEPAVLLLTTKTRRDALTDDEWKGIAAWVGHLPLALQVLNRLLQSGAMSAHDVLALSRDQGPSKAIDDAMESIRGVVEPGALRGVTEAFSTSYNLLTPQEQYAARLIAWMAPAPIPTFVIDAFGPEIFAPDVRSKLRNRSFVTEVRDGSSAYFGAIHRVLADFIRPKSTAPEQEVLTVASLLADLMYSADGKGGKGSALVRTCAPLISSIFSHWGSETTADPKFDKACDFANEMGVVLERWGHPALAGDLFESLVAALRRRYGDEHADTLSAMNNLASARVSAADYAGAQELLERVLEMRRRLLGDEHPHTLAVSDNLALTLHASGEHARAQELQESVVAVMRRTLGDEHPNTLQSMNNLAVTLRDRGDYAGAQELQERVSETRQRIFGDEDPETLSVMSNLAVIKRDQGDPKGAQELQERVLEIMERVLGDEHPDTLAAMNNLAVTRSTQGNPAEAQELHQRVLKSTRRILGDDHPDTLAAINNLALFQRLQGDDAGVQELQEEALQALQRRLGVQHSLTTVAAWGLLGTYMARKNFNAAAQLLIKDLLWLVERDPMSLTQQQRGIQTELRAMIQDQPTKQE